MKRKNTVIPKYRSLRMFIIPFILFFVLTGPSTSFILLKNISLWNESYKQKKEDNNSSKIDSLNISNDGNVIKADSLNSFSDNQIKDSLVSKSDKIKDGKLNVSIGNKNNNNELNLNDSIDNILGWYGILAVIISGFIINRPFKLFFRNLRKGKKNSVKRYEYCRKWLLKTPLINSGLFFIYFFVINSYSLFRILTNQFSNDETTRKIYIQLFPVSIVASILVIVFVYFWQKHKVHIKYIEHIFTPDELIKRIFNLKVGRIRNRLWISSSMTTLLPLIIVMFYLLMSLTSIKEVGEMNVEKAKVLLGTYYKDTSSMDMKNFYSDFSKFFYVNTINSMMMIVGISMGMLVSLIYIVLFVKWTTQDIVQPVKELLDNMKRTGEGQMDQYAIVRTNDEIGELTEGYNDMSLKIKTYINNITKINKANSRFVPQQFLDFLNKNDVTDIEKGDQVQKEMTILFADIRSFTSISEKMTPKENFDFINSYLEFMEPAINSNKGFIDKYIGDAIMALFGNKTDDAINAALSMRKQLFLLNRQLISEGKSPVNIGIGIHTGNLMLGIVGGSERLQGTVISNAVNLASRIEGLTKLYGTPIIISENTLQNIGNKQNFYVRYIDNVRVLGKKESVKLYEVLDTFSNADFCPQIIDYLPEYQKAIDFYLDKNFEEALLIFEKMQLICTNDPIISMYKERCKHFNQKGIPTDWDGVEIINEK